AIEELKTKHGLLWQSTADGTAAGTSVIIGDRIVNIGRQAGDTKLIARDASSGATVWVQPAERFSDAVADATGRVWYASGKAADPNAVVLYSLDVRTGERRELAQWRRSH